MFKQFLRGLLAGAGLVALSACQSGSSTDPAASGTGTSTQNDGHLKIKHVVIIFQENRTPDNLFHDQVLVDRGADIEMNSGMTSTGVRVPLVKSSMIDNIDVDHGHAASLKQWNHGKMDSADLVPVYCFPFVHGQVCPPKSYSQYQYVDPAEVQPYFQMAETYAFGDRMFQSNIGASFPAHQIIFSGASTPGGGKYAEGFDDDLVDANPNLQGPNGGNETAEALMHAGCTAPAGERVDVIDADPAKDDGTAKGQVFPCFEHPTMGDVLDQAGISWRYYSDNPDNVWVGPNAIDHIRNGSDWLNILTPSATILSDITDRGQLADVTWVMPPGASSDHDLFCDTSGPSWVSSVVNAIGNSPYWDSTAIFITWDDWGGWFDHVAPPSGLINANEPGLRVPLIVISPYVKRQYISHTFYTFGSILKFVESDFLLPTIGASVGKEYSDAHPGTSDMMDLFDFTQAPAKFTPIAAPLDASYFLTHIDTTVPLDTD